MKLTKTSLRQMIKEETDKIKLQQQRVTAAAGAKELRSQAANAGKSEIDDGERGLIQQIMDTLQQIATAPDVNLVQYRSAMNTFLVNLRNKSGAELGGGEEAEMEEL